MTDAEPKPQHGNLIAGIVTLALAGVVILVIVGISALKSAQPEPRHFIIYVKNAGTLGAGDPVYMSGRRVGSVREVEVVKHEGEVQVRVDFRLFNRVRDLSFPSDTTAVVAGPGLMAGPRLVLSYGENGTDLQSGDEIKDVVPAEELDLFAGYAESAAELEKAMDGVIEMLNDDEFITGISDLLSRIRTGMAEFEAQANELKPLMTKENTVVRLTDFEQQLADAHDQLITETADLLALLEDLKSVMEDSNANIDELSERTKEAVVELREYQDMTAEMAASSEDAATKEMILQLRWETATLAAQLRYATLDPAAAGAHPPGLEREHFNGGKSTLGPLGGKTDISEID